MKNRCSPSMGTVPIPSARLLGKWKACVLQSLDAGWPATTFWVLWSRGLIFSDVLSLIQHLGAEKHSGSGGAGSPGNVVRILERPLPIWNNSPCQE
eukprot:2265188-Amphidinium_carterae.1